MNEMHILNNNELISQFDVKETNEMYLKGQDILDIFFIKFLFAFLCMNLLLKTGLL